MDRWTLRCRLRGTADAPTKGAVPDRMRTKSRNVEFFREHGHRQEQPAACFILAAATCGLCPAGSDVRRTPAGSLGLGARPGRVGPDRHRVRGRASRRGHRTQGRRTVRHPGAGAGRNPDRRLADRVADAVGRRRCRNPGTRHRFRYGDDRLQWRPRAVPARRQRAAPRRQLPARGDDPGRRRAGDTRDAHPGAAAVHAGQRGADLLDRATRVRRRRVAAAVPGLRLRPDHSSPRLFPARRWRRPRTNTLCRRAAVPRC